jgi:hypothetical protein
MFKGLLYLGAFIFIVLLIIGNTIALSIFFIGILILSISVAIIDKHKKTE